MRILLSESFHLSQVRPRNLSLKILNFVSFSYVCFILLHSLVRHKLRLLFPKQFPSLIPKDCLTQISPLSVFSVSRIEIPRKKFAALIGPQLSQASDHKKKKGAIISMLLTASPTVSGLVAPCQQSKAFFAPEIAKIQKIFFSWPLQSWSRLYKVKGHIYKPFLWSQFSYNYCLRNEVSHGGILISDFFPHSLTQIFAY